MLSAGKYLASISPRDVAVEAFRLISGIAEFEAIKAAGAAAAKGIEVVIDAVRELPPKFQPFPSVPSAIIGASRFAESAPIARSSIKGDTLRVQAMAKRLSVPHPSDVEGNILALVVKSGMPKA